MANPILSLVPTMQSLTLLAENVPKKGKKFKPIKQGLKNIVGLSLIQETAKYTSI